MSVYVHIQYYSLLFLVTVIACFAQMIDLNEPPIEDEVNVHNTKSRPHSFDLSIPNSSREENMIKQSEPFYIKPQRTPAPQRTLKGKWDEEWNDKMRETFILRKIKREREREALSLKEQKISTMKAAKPKKGSIEWRNKISQGMQRYLKRRGKDEHADRQRLRMEKKEKKDFSSKSYLTPEGEK